MKRHLLLAACLALAPACLLDRNTTNVPPDPAGLATLTPGQSTAADVVRVLGAPAEVVQLGRRSAYRYEHTLAKRSGLWLLVVASVNTDTHSDRVWAFFDEQDVLTHIASTYESGRSEFDLAWSE